MTQAYDLEVAGPLNLNAHLEVENQKDLKASGRFAFSLSDSLNQTLGLLPFGLGKKLAKGMITKRLTDSGYAFDIKTQVSTDITVSDDGLMTLSTRYHSPFAKGITHNEFERVFKQFAQELFYVGIRPSSEEYLKDFIKSFKSTGTAQLHFAHLFEGKHLDIEDLPPHNMANFTIDDIKISQDEQGDLVVHFEASGILKHTD